MSTILEEVVEEQLKAVEAAHKAYRHDPEALHSTFDDIATQTMQELGAGKLVMRMAEIENEVGFWYA